MMKVSQKCQYALRAVFELAKHYGEGPRSAADIADAQAVPPRFLELILRELRQGGVVESRRGAHGGYLLAISPELLTAGDVVRQIDGPFAPVDCIQDGAAGCPLGPACAFRNMWERARDAVGGVLDTTTLGELVEAEREVGHVPSYSI